MPKTIPFFLFYFFWEGGELIIIKGVCFPTKHCLLLASDLRSSTMLILPDFHPRPLGQNSMLALEIPPPQTA